MSNEHNAELKQLRNEVQLLRDELAIMKRKYEDIIYNLDTDNFSQRIVKQGKDMYTKIEQTAEKITLQAEKIEENSSSIGKLTVSADEIRGEVFDKNGNSIIKQTASAIRSEINDLDDDLRSEIEQTAEKITFRVEDLESFQGSTFIQNVDGFTLEGEKTAFTGVIFLTDNNEQNKTSLFHDESQEHEQVIFHSISYNIPIIIGDYDSNVYIGNNASGYEVATRGWVLDQLGQ